VARFAAFFAQAGSAGALAVRRDPPPTVRGAAILVENGSVVRIAGDPAQTPFAHASLWAASEPLLAHVEDLHGPPYELAEAFQAAIDAGLAVAAREVGRTRDLTRALDLVQENFPYLAGPDG
jgi:hypothetical protein